MKFLAIQVCLFFMTSSLWAKSFSNQYTEFELPPNWECVLEGSEYVCQSTNSDRITASVQNIARSIIDIPRGATA